MSAERALTRTRHPGIFRRGESYVVTYRDDVGKQRRKSFRTLADAKAFKGRVTSDLAEGSFRQESRVSFSEYADTWRETYRRSRGIRESSMKEYDRAIRVAAEHFGRRRLSSIRTLDVERYVLGFIDAGLSYSTARLQLAALRVLFGTAVRHGLIATNPCRGVRLRRPADDLESEATVAKAQALTEEELRALLAAMAPEWTLLVSFLADTGLRIGEALALQWKHVDLGARRVQVRRRVYEGKMAKPKTKYGVRDVPISSALAQDLWLVRGKSGEDALVFARADGGLVSPSTVLRAVREAGRRAGVPWVTVHCLRHTCATRLFRRGVNAKVVQVWLGHHSPAFTLSVYTHLIADDMPEPDEIFGPVGGQQGTTAAPETAGIPEEALRAKSA